jgi:CRP-like cAMP-binding protein
MSSENNIAHALTSEDFNKIKLLGTPKVYKQGHLIFSDGDDADYIYFIESGSVSIFIEKFTEQEEISALGPGEYFGEMAFFSGDKRSASATAMVDTTLMTVGKVDFLDLFESDREIADKINQIFQRRNQELSFKEHLAVGSTSAGNTSFHLGIKGDPSLRFSAFTRERYDSVVDRIISDLQPRLYDLLMNRSAYEIFIHCNSGEVHIRTIFDPFNGEMHPASKLLNIAYIERHFPAVPFEKKCQLIKDLYQFIGDNASSFKLPDRYLENMQASYTDWQPVSQSTIANTLSKLSLLRKIENFYMRNFSISIVRDSIRMQFNCDGTQIVNAQGFQEFLEQNLDEDAANPDITDERRGSQRRTPAQLSTRIRFQQGERRGPTGRRQKDWETINRSNK